jgi:bifunctional DNase/RNase
MTTSGRIGMIVVLTIILTSVAGPARSARDQAETAAPRANGLQEAEVVAVAVDPRTQAPMIVLQGKRDKRNLAMAIGLAEATGIALPLQNITPPRPLTHDLFLTLFGRLKVTVNRVVINDMRDDIYYATVYLNSPGGEMVLDSRPSDAIALAIRAKVPVLVEDRVWEKGGTQPAPRRPSI